MLKQRIITAIVLITLLLIVFFVLPVRYFAWAVGGVTLLAAWEWSALCGIENRYLRIGYLAFLVLIFLGLNYLPVPDMISTVSCMAVLWWLWSMVWVLRFQRQVQIMQSNPLTFSLIGILILIPFWSSTVILNFEQIFNPAAGQLLLFVIILVALADTTAYFVGRRWGRHKLASRVSPGKTWEGLAGALFAVTFFVMPLAQILGIAEFSRVELTAIGVTIVIAALFGDLFESLAKRIAGVKDSGKLLPGHGGILDRIDAYTAAIPVFMAGYFYLM